jgi:hypothetical protein
MSRTDNLYVETDLSPQETLAMVFKGIGYEAQIKEFVRHGLKIKYAEAPEFVAYPRSLPKNFLHPVQISPSVSIRFEPNRELDWNIPKTILIRATMELIQKTGWNIILELWDAEVVALFNKSGQLILNSQVDIIWTPERLKMVGIPYNMKPIARP